MNPAKTAEYAARIKAQLSVMNAFAQGELIEVRDVRERENDPWLPCACPSWNFASNTYRVKPKPREIKVIEVVDRVAGWVMSTVWIDGLNPYAPGTTFAKELSRARSAYGDSHTRVIEFIEKPSC